MQSASRSHPLRKEIVLVTLEHCVHELIPVNETILRGQEQTMSPKQYRRRTAADVAGTVSISVHSAQLTL